MVHPLASPSYPRAADRELVFSDVPSLFNSIGLIAFLLTLTAMMVPAAAQQSAADRLSDDLTPIGAERSGNADGTIPPWQGGLSTLPDAADGWSPDQGPHPDPFADDRSLYTITKANFEDYETLLTDGYKALLKAYPDYAMPVYTSRRSCPVPDAAAAASRRNAENAALTADGNGVTGALMTSPFPITSNGLEMIWNHILRWRGHKVTRGHASARVNPDGSRDMTRFIDATLFQWSDPTLTDPVELDNKMLYYRSETTAPAREAGAIVLAHETINRITEPRNIWQYVPGLRKVHRAPDIAYDNPAPGSGGLSTADSINGFNGAPDRYQWRFVGKAEKLIPYNNYRLASASYDDLLTPLFPNPDLMRYERHRVWIVEARRKADQRHLYARRVFYIDEDSWRIALVEIYDDRDNLWRVQELPQLIYYEAGICGGAASFIFDLPSGRYLASSLRSQEQPINNNATLSASQFTPSALRHRGLR